MAQINIGKAPANSTVLPFYATGAFVFLILCIVMQITAESFLGHYFSPHMLTVVHLAALGWGTMIIFGAAHQLLPVICEQDLYSERAASFSWYTLTLGIALLTSSFWNLSWPWLMILGGSLIVISTLLYLLNAIKTSRLCKKYSIQKLFVISSGFWLLFTVTVGLLLAINLKYSYFERNHLDILKLHAHAGIAGWFLQLITGISTKLVPMFLLGKSSKAKLLLASFVLQNIGLIAFLTDGYFFGFTERIFIYLILIMGGIATWLLYLYDTYKKRIRKKIEIMMKQTFLSFACLICAVILVPVVYYTSDVNISILYGTFIFMGWITGIILGKTFKTLPFIVWNNHYKHLSGKVKVPLPKQLYNEKLIPWQIRIYLISFVTFALGIAFQSLWIIRVGIALWSVVALLYCYNVLIVLFHKTKTLS